MNRRVSFLVHGIPAPQGSKRHVGGGVMIESSKRVKPWREAVKEAALMRMDLDDTAPWCPMDGPLHLAITFYFPRPASHYGTGRPAGVLKESAPLYKASAPDLSKLIRSTEDALTDCGFWRDDSRVAALTCRKEYADTPGAWVAVTALAEGVPQ